MRSVRVLRFIVLTWVIVCALAVVGSGQDAPTGKNPVIVIPGLSGSELVNSKTGELVWFRPQRSKDDDIRLPVTTTLAASRDNLVPGDIMRTVQFVKFLPEIEIYERLVDVLQKRGGYREASWKTPRKEDFQDTFYVFPYDWRRDNVENARLLVQQIESLKRALKKPGLKFDVVAHSMGGLISRYAAMYGNADIGDGKKKPSWAGAKHFNKIFLVGTPNEGSVLSLQAVLEGVSFFGSGINIPFVQDINRYDMFSMPAMFQLLPQEGTLRAFDENLKQIELDLYDPKTWESRGWAIWQDDDFKKRLSEAEQDAARAYFSAVLERARRFQSALNANSAAKTPVPMYLLGADCKDTPNGVIVFKDGKKERWKAIFKPAAFERPDGTKVTPEELKPLLTALGDGVVTQGSLKGNSLGNKSAFPAVSELYQCESHNRLVTNADIQERLFALLFNTAQKPSK